MPIPVNHREEFANWMETGQNFSPEIQIDETSSGTVQGTIHDEKMVEAPEIADLAQLIQPYLGDSQLVSYTSRYLTKPGDHYGSLMIAIMANVKRPNGDIEELPLVAKLPPITNDFYWKVFQPERTCLSENSTYEHLASEVRKLEQEAGIEESNLFDGFSKYYGSRLSLNPNAKVADRDAVLILENLQTAGYKAGNRHKAYDREHTELVLKEMAKYHALAIALRLKKPKVFDKKIRPYFKRFYLNVNLSEEERAAFDNEVLKEVQLATNNNERAVERIRELAKLYEKFCNSPDAADGPFTTIAHCDLWINNVMIQYDEAGKPLRLKIVDFQLAQYEHVAHDIIFFLFSSVDTSILEQHYYDFLELYYKAFIDCLQSVGVSTTEYNYKNYLNEVQRIAHLEIWHALFMTKIILADNKTMPEDFKDVSMELMKENSGRMEIVEKTAEILRLAEKFKIMV